MRTVLLTLCLGLSAAALLPAGQARAWWDPFGRWHPGYYVRPPFVAPRPLYNPYDAARPYARWVPPHYNRWGQFIPGHWI